MQHGLLSDGTLQHTSQIFPSDVEQILLQPTYAEQLPFGAPGQQHYVGFATASISRLLAGFHTHAALFHEMLSSNLGTHALAVQPHHVHCAPGVQALSSRELPLYRLLATVRPSTQWRHSLWPLALFFATFA
jgi:hypothetical protein